MGANGTMGGRVNGSSVRLLERLGVGDLLLVGCREPAVALIDDQPSVVSPLGKSSSRILTTSVDSALAGRKEVVSS